jgi:regulator of replication initiation timing
MDQEEFVEIVAKLMGMYSIWAKLVVENDALRNENQRLRNRIHELENMAPATQ